MSSSISADYSPASNYSYPTNLSLSPSSSSAQVRPYIDQIPPPRLSSPHIFRDIFAGAAVGPSTSPPPRLPPLHEINFNETMQDVNRALQSANRAIQTAQEAFQTRRTSSTHVNRRQDIVDLTNSPPSPSRDDYLFDSFLTRAFHPHDSRSGNRTANRPLNEPYYSTTTPSAQLQSMFVEEDDPTSRYTGQSDSLAAARRRFAMPPANQRRSYIAMPNMERTLMRSGLPDTRRQEEEEAIRRQRVAREQWQQTRRRQLQRDRLQQQRDRIMARTSLHNDQLRQHNQQPHSRSNQQIANMSSSSAPINSGFSPPRASSSSSSLSSSVEAVDLTAVNTEIDLAAALLQSQSQSQSSNPSNITVQPRSALTAYKCPVCLEPPRNATTTICGHLFCHECILETLKNSENMRREDAPQARKVRGQCPVCRKELARKEEEGNARTLVPLEIKRISKRKMEDLRHQERKRQRELEKATNKGKGKEKVDADQDQGVFDLNSNNEDNWGASSSSQKENKAKRIKLSASEELDQELFGAYTYDEQG